jgi:hypothetical protein
MPKSATKDDSGNVLRDGQWRVLVVGDWIIDEDWVMAPERSATSALQMNERHFLTTFDGPTVGTKRLCGTSLTASAIRSFVFPQSPGAQTRPFDVYGIGVWHPDDNDYLEALFRSDALEGANPFRISRPPVPPTKPAERRLYNLAQHPDTACTTRVVRTFVGHAGTLPTPMTRYDWHAAWQPQPKPTDWHDFLVSRLRGAFAAMGVDSFDAVVVADFSKGLVTEKFLGALSECLPRAKGAAAVVRWYFRSKRPEAATWNQHLEAAVGGDDTLVRYLDPRTAARVVENQQLVCGSAITREGLDTLGRLALEQPDSYRLMLAFANNTALCFDSDGAQCWVLRCSEKPPSITRGRSSILLSTLVVGDFLAKSDIARSRFRIESFGDRAALALLHGQRWSTKCGAVWQEASRVAVVSAGIAEAARLPTDPGPVRAFGPFSMVELDRVWTQATTASQGCCIRLDNKALQLEVWRAHTTLNDYTVLDDERRRTVLSLCNVMRSFLALDEAERPRPCFSFAQASPGSGKTFLAKCLAREFGLDLFEFNLAQAERLRDLTHFMDQVDAAIREGAKPFVFIDEADNTVAGESAFGYLLDLLWCGYYNRDGLRHATRPFAGLVAISGDPGSPKFREVHPKFPDFKSRVYGISCVLKDFSDAEKIYLFAKLLARYVDQIAFVELGVLKAVAKTQLRFGPRSLELLISQLQGITRNTVTRAMLPSHERIKELIEHFPTQLAAIDTAAAASKLVRMIYNPPGEI